MADDESITFKSDINDDVVKFTDRPDGGLVINVEGFKEVEFELSCEDVVALERFINGWTD